MIFRMLVTALFAVGVSEAQTSSVTASLRAPGPLINFPSVASCGDWYAERRGESNYRWETDVTWVQGFISGHNAYVRPPENQMITAEPNEIAIWLDTYCQQNPTHYLMHAAAAFVEAHGGSNPLRVPDTTFRLR